METLKNVVMNPYSYPDAPNIPKEDVEKAIRAVEIYWTWYDANFRKQRAPK
jgi:hypothetical protein